ncbi:MAG: bifunctional diguanylate cyclase/phosphodiesterase [Coriobacteriales bacterium]|nr:bifunctional diguanylate cyclase/phosphodiesterase [Actinomycetes bacterium]
MYDRHDLNDYLLESWLEFHEALKDHPEVKRMLFDPVTGLPTTPLLFPRIESLLEERGEISLLCLNVVKYSKIEEIYGWKVFDEVMRQVADALEHITGAELRDSDMIAELMISGNAFVVVLSPPRTTESMAHEHLTKIARRVEDRVRAELKSSLDPALYPKFGCYVGAATVRHDPKLRLERIVHDALDRALAQADTREAQDAEERTRRLREILDSGEIRTLVHPVLRLDDLEVIGYEALSRGPEASEFERPDKLFKVAYDSDMVLKLERLCRKRALEAAQKMPPGRLMFVNVEPEAVADPELRDVMFSSLLAETELAPSSIVLEITEHTAIADFSAFRSTLEYLRMLGFVVAVDDAGAGYGSLQCLAEVHPEWLKIDISLVRGVDSDDVRYQLIESLVTFADKVGVKLVAEGIETREELEALRRLGVQYGQGFLFSEPTAPFPADEDIRLP